MVKKLLIVLPLAVLTVYSACDNRKPVHKESKSMNQVKEVNTAKVELMESEKDQFHKNSVFESVRKKKLTNFGHLKKEPPVRTPDLESLNESLGSSRKMLLEKEHKELLPIKGSTLVQGDFTFPVFPFDYENNISGLKRLAKDFKLEQIIDRKKSDLLNAQALTVCVNEYFKGLREPTREEFWTKTKPSAKTIAALKKEGIGGTSEHYAALLCQLGCAIGLNTRMVSMHTVSDSGEILTHTVCEMYLCTFNKWVVFDPYKKATYYLRGDEPQGALELRDAMMNSLFMEVTPVTSAGDFSDIVSVREKLLPLYEHLYLFRQNTFLDQNLTWRDLYANHLVWEDVHAPVAAGSFDKVDVFSSDGKEGVVKYVTHENKEFNWPISQVQIHIERKGESHLRFYLDATVPNFESFSVLVSSDGTQAIEGITGNTWDYYGTDIEADIRAKNVFGAYSDKALVLIARL